MRLTSEQQRQINTILKRYFGTDSEILLFGSRVDDNAKGGDLYIEPEIKAADAIVDAKLDAMVALHKALGDQKIDLVIKRRNARELPIYRIAKETGLPL